MPFAAYLVYLGVRLLLRKDPQRDVGPVAAQGARRALAEGIFVEALNVKTALFAIVAVGGALGSVGRYLLSGWTLHHTVDWRFPLGTFLVNVLGCLVTGALAGFAVKANFFSPEARLFLFMGICGGCTTFSAFGLETFHLLRRAEFMVAGSYVLLSVTVGLFALWVGFGAVPHRS